MLIFSSRTILRIAFSRAAYSDKGLKLKNIEKNYLIEDINLLYTLRQ
jgi:hypothetical protein